MKDENESSMGVVKKEQTWNKNNKKTDKGIVEKFYVCTEKFNEAVTYKKAMQSRKDPSYIISYKYV